MAETEQESAVQRDAKGRFVKGCGKKGRGHAPLSPEFRSYAEQAPERLRAIADDPETPVKVRSDIEKWFAEMWFGKSPQALGLEGKVESTGVKTIKFEGVLEEWSQ